MGFRDRHLKAISLNAGSKALSAGWQAPLSGLARAPAAGIFSRTEYRCYSVLE